MLLTRSESNGKVLNASLWEWYNEKKKIPQQIWHGLSSPWPCFGGRSQPLTLLLSADMKRSYGPTVLYSHSKFYNARQNSVQKPIPFLPGDFPQIFEQTKPNTSVVYLLLGIWLNLRFHPALVTTAPSFWLDSVVDCLHEPTCFLLEIINM